MLVGLATELNLFVHLRRFSTPAACDGRAAKELQLELSGSGGHDEL
jgi:hypothetical protein